jgi:hypothetical protein
MNSAVIITGVTRHPRGRHRIASPYVLDNVRFGSKAEVKPPSLRCLLYPRKGTSKALSRMSARDHKRTSKRAMRTIRRPDQAVAGRTRWLLVSAAFLRQRLRRSRRLLRVARGRNWTTDRLYLSDQQRVAGIREPQRLWRICRAEQARWLERLAHDRHCTGSSRRGAPISPTHDHEVGNYDIKARPD